MEHDRRKERRIKIIGLALCLLLVIATIWLLGLILRYPELLLILGPLLVFVLYRACFGSPEERQQERERRAARKAERCHWQKHRFFPVSKRGRAAYLILCLEEALKFYDSEDLDNWKWLLNELWQITSTWDIDEWVGRISDASYESIMAHSTYQEEIEHDKKIGFWFNLSEDEFVSLHALYSENKFFFPVIYALYDKIIDIIILDWGDLEAEHTPSALSAIEEAEQIITEHGIPFPQDQQALNFIMSHRDGHYGKPFNGIPLSSIL